MDYTFIAEAFPQILAAVPVTLLIVFSSVIIGWLLGLLVAIPRKNKTPVVSQVLAVFVSFMRSVPSVILLYISYFVMPSVILAYGKNIGIEIDISNVSAVIYAIITMVLAQIAFSSEVFRAAIAAVDEGQMEAAYSVGMTKIQAYMRIIFPQAFATAIPSLGGLFICLVKDTSLAYYVGVHEITATANILSIPKLNYIEAYVMTTVIYEVLSFIFDKGFRIAEKHFKKFRANATA
jgi:His/Glu/Gln/Arg/opine family amino acid ABC transporter permease subunit